MPDLLDPATFDRAKPLVLARGETINGHDLVAGTTVELVDEETDARAQLTEQQAVRLWAGGTLIYADRALPTPVESPRQMAERVTVLEPMGNGQFLLRAPWLGEGEIIKGAEKAGNRRREVVEEGVAKYQSLAESAGLDAAVAEVGGVPDGFEIAEVGSNGYYEINGPGLDEPEKVRGRANAEARMAELRAAAAAEQGQSGAATPPAIPTAEVPEPAGNQGGLALTDGLMGVDTSAPGPQGPDSDAADHDGTA